MSIKIAQQSDIDIVKDITHTTIKAIYPHYYSNGAVVFFLKAIPHKDCATDASSNFSSDETKSGVNT